MMVWRKEFVLIQPMYQELTMWGESSVIMVIIIQVPFVTALCMVVVSQAARVWVALLAVHQD